MAGRGGPSARTQTRASSTRAAAPVSHRPRPAHVCAAGGGAGAVGAAVASPDWPASGARPLVSIVTGARNRKPRLGSVCTNRGFSPLSPSAVRTWAMQ